MKKNKFFIAFFLVISIILFFINCRKTEKLSSENNLHYLDPKEIFFKTSSLPYLPPDNPLSEEGVYLGRMLFYDPILSKDSSIACASCHKQEKAFAEETKVSTGIFRLKTTRNSMSLANLAYNQYFFWDGRKKTLREQVLEPIQAHNEMGMTLQLVTKRLNASERYKKWFKTVFNATPDVFNMSLALEQFLMQLVSKNSKFDKVVRGRELEVLTVDEFEGLKLFQSLFDPGNPNSGADCGHCHGGVLTQSQSAGFGGIANNGLDSVFKDLGVQSITGNITDKGKFKTPTLRNIALTAPYMHDGRFATLEEVINHYSDFVYFGPFTDANLKHNLGGINYRLNLTTQKKQQLVSFLKTLTDSSFIKNPKFANPF